MTDHGAVELPPREERVRLALYRSLAATGRAPSSEEIERQTGVERVEVARVLRGLAEARHVVLDRAGEVVLAHPFATRSFGFAVMGAATLWWGGCAWDSFAIPHLVTAEPAVLVATTCPNCGTPHAWSIGRDRPPAGEQLAHFAVPVADIWNDVVHACANQRIYCNEVCVTEWLLRKDVQLGAMLSLEELWNLASGWYAGRLESGYVRRDPTAATDYFRSVGLSGEFWGLD